MSAEKKMGRLYGAGVGVGDLDLTPLRSQRIISQAPIIFGQTYSDEEEPYAKTITEQLAPGTEHKFVKLLVNDLTSKEQLEKAADIIYEHLQGGEDGVFVNIGDPLLYGSFVHIFEVVKRLHPDLEIEIVPGVSVVLTAAAMVQVPLALENDRIAILSGNPGDDILRTTLQNFQTVVFMKMHTMFDSLIKILEELDLVDKCIYTKKWGTPEEVVIRGIGGLKGEEIDFFSLMVMRK